jgi:hypothetical protein
MSPCCLAAATATAVLTALIVVGLTGFVLLTDGFGLGMLLSTLLAVVFQRLRLIGPCPRLLYGLSILLAVRALWLLATTRRSLVIATWRSARLKASWVAVRLTPVAWVRRGRFAGHHCADHASHAAAGDRLKPPTE